MASTSFNHRSRNHTQVNKRYKLFFAGKWHYAHTPKESNHTQKAHEGQNRARILTHRWLARHDVPSTAKKTLHPIDTDDSNWAYNSNFDDDYGFDDLQPLHVVHTARRKKNINNRTSRKKNWDSIFSYIVMALSGQDLASEHSKDCSLQPREILFVNCTCMSIPSTYKSFVLFLCSNTILHNCFMHLFGFSCTAPRPRVFGDVYVARKGMWLFSRK